MYSSPRLTLLVECSRTSRFSGAESKVKLHVNEPALSTSASRESEDNEADASSAVTVDTGGAGSVKRQECC